jgi:prephenate dehydrogenase
MNNVLIVGLGLIGGSIAKALKASKNDLNVYGFDKSEAVLKAAIGDETINNYINIDDDFDSIKDNKIDFHNNLHTFINHYRNIRSTRI